MFSLNSTWHSGATYEWSNGNTSTYVGPYELSGMPPGRHEFRITITDPICNCEIESEPMTIIIHPLPDPILLSSSSVIPCEGEEHTITVDNPDPNLLYYWSNGDSGLSTTVSKSGPYTVTAINKNGCERESPRINIYPVPDANNINVGCLEACFPDTICIPWMGEGSSMQWLFNGLPFGGIKNNSNSSLIALEAGEYQLIVENIKGAEILVIFYQLKQNQVINLFLVLFLLMIIIMAFGT